MHLRDLLTRAESQYTGVVVEINLNFQDKPISTNNVSLFNLTMEEQGRFCRITASAAFVDT